MSSPVSPPLYLQLTTKGGVANLRSVILHSNAKGGISKLCRHRQSIFEAFWDKEIIPKARKAFKHKVTIKYFRN